MSWDDIYSCPVCGTEECVPARGPKNSPFLIIASHPGDDEVREGKPMVGASGTVLRQELLRNGVDIKQIRICNLWYHVPNKNEKCLLDGAQRAIAEAKDKKIILLIGSDTVKYFAKVSVEAYNGLEVKCAMLSAPTILACVQPTTVFHGPLGEFRYSISEFSRRFLELS